MKCCKGTEPYTHGHAVIEDSGQITYLRGQYQDHNDWQINDMADLADKDG